MQKQTVLIVSKSEPDITTVLSLISPELEGLHETHPDLMTLSPKGKANSIGIDQVRKLVSWTYNQPFQHSLKCGIIQMAHAMTPQAQNGLLKTIEETPNFTQLVLVTHNPSLLLPTVLSRVQTHNLHNPAIAETNTEDIPRNFLLGNLSERGAISDKLIKTGNRAEVQSFINSLLNLSIADPTLIDQQRLHHNKELLVLALKNLKAGGNLRLTLQTLAISMR